MSRMRQRIAEKLKEAQNTAAMLTTFQECDMSELMALRKQFKDEFEKVHGVKLGFMSAFVKASTAALQEIPAVNAVIDDATKEIVYKSYCDVSVAVASPNGLVVPVLRDAETMSFADVEKAIAGFAAKAKSGTLSLEDMAGGTFSISNGGVFGSLMGTPIINFTPQAAILGMHATKMRPVVVDGGKVEARPMMYVSFASLRFVVTLLLLLLQVPGPHLRPPHHRRSHGGRVPADRQAAPRIPRQPARLTKSHGCHG